MYDSAEATVSSIAAYVASPPISNSTRLPRVNGTPVRRRNTDSTCSSPSRAVAAAAAVRHSYTSVTRSPIRSSASRIASVYPWNLVRPRSRYNGIATNGIAIRPTSHAIAPCDDRWRITASIPSRMPASSTTT